jgi:hypothetical protein
MALPAFRIQKILWLLVCICIAIHSNAQNTGGIGAMLAIDSSEGYRMPIIRKVLPNSPAAASLKDSMFILKVNETSCRDKTIEEVVGMIRGEAGTHVKLTAADNKQGRHAKDYDLIRAVIAQPGAPPTDIVTAFNNECDNGVKLLKKQGRDIVQTFTSECGDFYFNFNAGPGTYHVRVFTIAEGTGPQGTGANAQAKISDSNNEPGTVQLTLTGIRGTNNAHIVQLDGEITFGKTGVGTIGIQIDRQADISKCKAMYIVVYK